MSEKNKSTLNLSDEEAKQEHDDIQREIAEKKGLKYEPDGEKPEEKKETEEPADEEKKSKEDESLKDDEDLEDTDPDEKETEDVDPKDPDYSKPRKKSLLGKYQTEKKGWQAKEAEMQKQIDDLSKSVNRAKTEEGMKEKVKAYAEKHEMSEEAVMDLLLLQREAIAPDPDVRATLEESKALIQKNKAIEAFENEFSNLIDDIPDAAEMRNKIRAEAYKEENLDKSLFEIYHRLNRKPETVKKKTGESQRGAVNRDVGNKSFDLAAVAAKVKSGASGALQGLTGEQTDQVFALLDKEGSRYS